MRIENKSVPDRRLVSAIGLLAILLVAGCGLNRTQTQLVARSSSGTQLELSIGLKEDEWGRYSLAQLVIIKGLLESDDVSESEKLIRIAFAKKYPPLGF